MPSVLVTMHVRYPIHCRHSALPRYGTIYATSQECQDACTNQVVGCNAVNYAPSAVDKRCVLFEEQVVAVFAIKQTTVRVMCSLVCTYVGYRRADANFYFVVEITNFSHINISMP